MRKKIVAGNWKMNKTVDEGINLASEICEFTDKNPSTGAEVILCAPFTHLYPVGQVIKGSRVKSGAQNCSSEESGAFTGEISASMIVSTGSQYVIIGHSERRSIFGEDDLTLNRKVAVALKNGLKVIFCCGETLPQRENEMHFNVVKEQLEKGIFSLLPVDMENIVIAYEPVWAIGTGVTATSAQAQEMHKYIRELVSGHFGEKIASEMTILYGGSCNPKNAAELFGMDDVDGGLIGGASLKADDFCSIITSF